MPLQNAILINRNLPPPDELVRISDIWSSTYGSPPIGAEASKQAAWLKPVTETSKALLATSLSTERESAILKAAETRHSGDWLQTLPISSCGLRLDDEAIRIAVSLRLGLDICLPHRCRCGSEVDCFGSHSFICKFAKGKGARHFAINDIFARALASAGFPNTKEPTGLIKGEGKRPDGMTLVPWRQGRPLAWDATISTPLASSYVHLSAKNAGASAEAAEIKKTAKYAHLAPGIAFQALALDSLGGASNSTKRFIDEIGHKLSGVTFDPTETAHLWQQISICINRYNALLVSESFDDTNRTPDE